MLSLVWLAHSRSEEFVGGGGGEGVCSVSGLLSVKFNLQLFWREKKGREREKKRVQSRQKEKIIFFTKRKKEKRALQINFSVN